MYDHLNWPDEKLHDRMGEIAANKAEIKYSPDRSAQLSTELALLAFELSERERERRGFTIEEAWGIHDGANQSA